MKKFIMSVFISFVFLTGCSNDEAYNNALQKGKDFITSEEYQKAESAFELALDEKMNDEQATVLLTQTVSYQELIKEFNEGNFDLAKENADKVIQIENGTPTLVEKSEEALELIEAIEEILLTKTEQYEKALNSFENEKYEDAKVQLSDTVNMELDHPKFDSLDKRIEILNDDIQVAILNEKKEKEAREEKERKANETEVKEKTEFSVPIEAEPKAGSEEKSQNTYKTEKKDWKPRAEYEAEMKKKNEEKRKSREAYDAEMKQRNADRDKRNRERKYWISNIVLKDIVQHLYNLIE